MDELMFDRDLPTEREMSFNILYISEVMVIQGLTNLSEELPKGIRTPSLPK